MVMGHSLPAHRAIAESGAPPLFLKYPPSALLIPEICKVFATRLVYVLRPMQAIEATCERRNWAPQFGAAGVIVKSLDAASDGKTVEIRNIAAALPPLTPGEAPAQLSGRGEFDLAWFPRQAEFDLAVECPLTGVDRADAHDRRLLADAWPARDEHAAHVHVVREVHELGQVAVAAEELGPGERLAGRRRNDLAVDAVGEQGQRAIAVAKLALQRRAWRRLIPSRPIPQSEHRMRRSAGMCFSAVRTRSATSSGDSTCSV